jgi:hypothetical protein
MRVRILVVVVILFMLVLSIPELYLTRGIENGASVEMFTAC